MVAIPKIYVEPKTDFVKSLLEVTRNGGYFQFLGMYGSGKTTTFLVNPDYLLADQTVYIYLDPSSFAEQSVWGFYQRMLDEALQIVRRGNSRYVNDFIEELENYCAKTKYQKDFYGEYVEKVLELFHTFNMKVLVILDNYEDFFVSNSDDNLYRRIKNWVQKYSPNFAFALVGRTHIGSNVTTDNSKVTLEFAREFLGEQIRFVPLLESDETRKFIYETANRLEFTIGRNTVAWIWEIFKGHPALTETAVRNIANDKFVPRNKRELENYLGNLNSILKIFEQIYHKLSADEKLVVTHLLGMNRKKCDQYDFYYQLLNEKYLIDDRGQWFSSLFTHFKDRYK